MRLARLAGLGVALTATAAGAQRPAPRTPTPDLTLWSPSSANPLMTVGAAQNFYLSVDRDAYVAAFEVGRDGRMRVLYPRTPKDAAGRVKGGKTVSVLPWSYELLGIAVSRTEVPYVIALASDDPIDLTRFGQGKTWQYRVRLDGGREPDVTMENVARLIQRDSAQRFTGDYGYVAPRVAPSTQLALSRCTSLTSFSMGRDAHDYWLYRDLWMTFGPRDGYWFGSVSPWIGWGWNGLAPMLFPSVASWPVAGGGCTPTVRLPAYASIPQPLTAPVRADTTRRDSTRTDSVRASAAGRTIAVEQPRGEGGEALPVGEAAHRFSPAEIARIREGFYTEADGNAAHGAMVAGRHAAAPEDRRGAGWAPEPMDARPTPRGSRYAEPEEPSAPRWPTRAGSPTGPARNDPDRVDTGSAGSGTGGWQRPTSVGGADVTRAAAPEAPIGGASGGIVRPAGVAPGGTASPAGTTPPKGQQQQQQQQQSQ